MVMRPITAALLLLCLALTLLGCVQRNFSARDRAPAGSPIAGIDWDQRTPMPAVGYAEGPTAAGYWWRIRQTGRRLEIGRAGQTAPQVTADLNGGGARFMWDPVTESYRLEKSGPFQGGLDRLTALTPGNRRQEPYGIVAVTDATGEEALYGLLGKPSAAQVSSAPYFQGGYLLSRRRGDTPQASFSGKAQVRLDGSAVAGGLSLLLTAPPELPRLFGSRVGAIQLTSRFNPSEAAFATQGSVDAVGAGADARLRTARYALFGRVLNDGRSVAGLFRLLDDDGEAIAVGAFTTQSTERAAPQTSRR